MFMRKFILLSINSALIASLLSELSFINNLLHLTFWVLFIGINIIFYLAYEYDEVFIKAFKKPLEKLLIKDMESFNILIILMWISFNSFSIIWRWS